MLIALLGIIGVMGCESWGHVEGNENLVVENRNTGIFNKVVSSGDFQVRIVQDSVFDITVKAESNLQPYINTTVNDKTLGIDPQKSLYSHKPIWIYVHVPEIRKIEMNGSGLIEANDMVYNTINVDLNGSGNIYCSTEAKSITIDIDGSGFIETDIEGNSVKTNVDSSGDIYLEGSVNKSDIDIKGSGDIEAYNLVARKSLVNIKGSGDAKLYVKNILKANISGSGSVYYQGNPSVHTVLTGSGEVIDAF